MRADRGCLWSRTTTDSGRQTVDGGRRTVVGGPWSAVHDLPSAVGRAGVDVR